MICGSSEHIQLGFKQCLDFIQQDHPEIKHLDLDTRKFSEDLSISNLEKLRKLDISCCFYLSDEELRKVILASGGLIEVLDVTETNITGQFSDGLDDTKLKKLKDLNLLQMNLARTAITREIKVRNTTSSTLQLYLLYLKILNIFRKFGISSTALQRKSRSAVQIWRNIVYS